MNTRTGTSTRTCCTKPTKSKMLLSSLTLLGLVASVNAAQSMPYVRTKDLQGVADPENAKWISMSKDIDFLPVDDLPKKKRPSKRARSLENDEEEEDDAEYYADEDGDGTGEWEKYNPYSVQPFVEGMGDYDEYQQAWRLLGFMIDCNSVSSEEQDEHGGSGSADVSEDGCARYVLWAAVSGLWALAFPFLAYLCFGTFSNFLLDGLICDSMSTWSTKAVGSESTSTTMKQPRSGIAQLVSMLREVMEGHDAPGWIATWRTPTFRF